MQTNLADYFVHKQKNVKLQCLKKNAKNTREKNSTKMILEINSSSF